MYSTNKINGTIFATLLFLIPVFAKDHTILNGTWTMLPAKSDFAGQPVIQTGTVTINEREGNITVSRNFRYEGAGETFFYRNMTDSENSATIHSGRDLKSKTKWDHNVLKVLTTHSGVTTEESYSLNADGTMTGTVMVPSHKPITLTFRRQ